MSHTVLVYAGRCACDDHVPCSRPARASSPCTLVEKATDKVSTAFEQIWQAGVVHGDVAARNVVISDDGAPTTVDFGDTRLRKDSTPAEWAGLVSDEHVKVKDMIASRVVLFG